LEWLKEVEERGAGEILLTSMDSDGTRNGYDIGLLNKVRDEINIPLIASGGAGSPGHLKEALSEGADAVLAASIFHQKDYSLQKCKSYLLDKDIPVRRKKL
jgi:cyclase